MSFSRISDVMDLPYLIEIQKSSYDWFLEKGLMEVFDDINPIVDFSGNLYLEFIDYSLDSQPKYSVEECKERDTNYSASLKIKIRLTNKNTGEIKEQFIYMADFPVMTDTGTFIINGAERVVVSQLVRSPGAYFSKEIDKHGKDLFASQIIPNRGAWLEFETDSNNILYVRVDRTRKVPITILLRAIGLGTNAKIIEMFGEEERLLATLQKDPADSVETGLTEIYKRLRPGEPAPIDSARPLFMSMFFDPKRYDLMLVGRYKLNKKLALAARIAGCKSAENIANPKTGELICAAGELISEETAWAVQNSGINRVKGSVEDGKEFIVIGNGVVDAAKYGVPFDPAEADIDDMISVSELEKILASGLEGKDLLDAVRENKNNLLPKTITADDIIAAVNYNLGLDHNIGEMDDIDHLGNRRLRSVGELLQNQFRIGLARLERSVREEWPASPCSNPKRSRRRSSSISVPSARRSRNSSVRHSCRSLWTDESAWGTDAQKAPVGARSGGLSRERAGFDVRDVHHSHYGRVCPIETPEGPNIG
jgi:DNA-directed RNA polymerase subunit beta